MAAALVAGLDCAVLAMRYPVVDDFAINLAGSFYDLLLGKDHRSPARSQLQGRNLRVPARELGNALLHRPIPC